MKIGILTHPLTTNYGGILQNYALQKVLKDLGHTPITLDYTAPTPPLVKILSLSSRLMKRLRGSNVSLRGWPTAAETAIIAQHPARFVSRHIATTPPCRFSNLASLCSENFDALIVGSDQVWRADRGHVERYFFSDFTHLDIPKIAYAASMGVDRWIFSPKQTVRCRKLAARFTAVSVREDSAVDLCRQHLGIDAQRLLDPTLLHDRQTYVNLVGDIAAAPETTTGKIMTYILDPTIIKTEITHIAAHTLGLTTNSVMARASFLNVGAKRLQDCIFPPVEDWISGFINAPFVVTDSFHGTVFAIIFNKPFIAIANDRRGRARFTSLLQMVGLENRLIETTDQARALLTQPIDYTAVNKILNAERLRSLNFLKNNLK